MLPIELEEKILARILMLETLDTRGNDELDFHTLPVWTIRTALSAAYDLGVISNDKPPTSS